MFAYPSYDAEFRGSNPVGVVLALRPQRHRPGGAKTRYSLCVRQLVRQNLPFFLAATLAGFGLRLFFLLKFPHVTADSNFYADIARNWLLRGVYGLTTDPGQISPTYARLPGYPAFLAFVFALFGIDNFKAVMIVQILVDLGTCVLVADLARLMLGSARSAKAALLLAALCPFLAQYSAAALTETLEIFFTALALNCAVRGLSGLHTGAAAVPPPCPLLDNFRPWIRCGLAVAACILLRPMVDCCCWRSGSIWAFNCCARETTRARPGTLCARDWSSPPAPWHPSPCGDCATGSPCIALSGLPRATPPKKTSTCRSALTAGSTPGLPTTPRPKKSTGTCPATGSTRATFPPAPSTLPNSARKPFNSLKTTTSASVCRRILTRASLLWRKSAFGLTRCATTWPSPC